MTAIDSTATPTRRKKFKLSDLVANPVFPFLTVIAIWSLVSWYEVFSEDFFVSPLVVLERAIDLTRKGILPDYLADSVYRLILGATIGMLLGLALGYLIGLNRYIRKLMWPVILFFQAVADIAWLPLLIVWFGFGLISITSVIVYAVVFPLTLSVIAGIDGVPTDLLRAARSLGANRRQVFREVILPGSLAATTTGIRSGLGYGWRALITAEIIIGTSGIGFMMFDARRGGDISTVFLGMIILGALWYAFDSLVLAPLEKQTIERWGLVNNTDS